MRTVGSHRAKRGLAEAKRRRHSAGCTLKSFLFLYLFLLYNDYMSNTPNKTKDKNGGLKTYAQRLRAKLLSSYYGKPIKDMKLIAITGSTGKCTVAHYIHEILNAAGEQVAVLASDQPFKTAMLHKFLNDAWKAGANYVIVTTPADSLRNNVFYGLPVYIAAMTNFVTASLADPTPDEFIDDEKTLFDMNPDYVILNTDDLNYDAFKTFTGKKSTITYGRSGTDIRVLNSKLYKKGSEATISLDGEFLNVASFVSGEPAVSYMACAVAIAHALNINNNKIIEGIANYDPDETPTK